MARLAVAGVGLFLLSGCATPRQPVNLFDAKSYRMTKAGQTVDGWATPTDGIWLSSNAVHRLYPAASFKVVE